MNRNLVTSIMLAALLTIVATESASARHRMGYGWGPWGWTPPPASHGRADKPSVTYAGDCGPNPPPGYRWDLKDWRTGFSDRDFSCYILTGPN